MGNNPSLKFYHSTKCTDFNLNNHGTHKRTPTALHTHSPPPISQSVAYNYRSKLTFSRKCGMPHPYHGSCRDHSAPQKRFPQINQQTCYSQQISTSTNIFRNEYWCWHLILRPAVYRQFANGAANAAGQAVHVTSSKEPNISCAAQFLITLFSQFLSKLGQWLVK